MKRVVWVAVGATVAVVVIVQGRKLLRKVTPEGVQEQAAAKANDLASRAGEFFSTLTSSMTEREAELREQLGVTDAPAEWNAPVPVKRPARA